MNKTILMGRLVKDPELRYTAQNNTAICSFTLAVPKRISKTGEEKQAEFIPIVAWGKQAEFCSNMIKKIGSDTSDFIGYKPTIQA